MYSYLSRSYTLEAQTGLKSCINSRLANRVAVTDLRPLLPGPRALQQRFTRLLEQIAFRGLLCPGKVDHLDRLIVLCPSAPSLAHVDYHHAPRVNAHQRCAGLLESVCSRPSGALHAAGAVHRPSRGMRCCPVSLRRARATACCASMLTPLALISWLTSTIGTPQRKRSTPKERAKKELSAL